MKKLCRKISVMLVAFLFITAVTPAGFSRAEFQNSTNIPDKPAEITLPDNDKLFAGYVNQLFGIGAKQTIRKNYGEKRLSGVNLNLYHYLKDQIKKIASGEISSTEFTFTPDDIGIEKKQWTNTELGVSNIFYTSDQGIELTEEAITALEAKTEIDFSLVKTYLMCDSPYEFYWFDKTMGTITNIPIGKVWLDQDGTEQMIGVSNYYIAFSVADEYKDGDHTYAVDTSKIHAAQTAVANAKAIVEQYRDTTSSYEKIKAYADEICALVSYNDSALADDVSYGNPWQLIWVFDGDPDTNVVCEGYSKAFQYLCDLTDFINADVDCYTVCGVAGNAGNAGYHMWNVVTMYDRKNYIVDVTNSDAEGIGSKGGLVIAPASYSALYNQYTVQIDDRNTITYQYDYDMDLLYSRDVLSISSTPFDETAAEPISTPTTAPTKAPAVISTTTPATISTALPTETSAANETASPTETPAANETVPPTVDAQKPAADAEHTSEPTVTPLKAGDRITAENGASYQVLSTGTVTSSGTAGATVEYLSSKKAASAAIPATVTLNKIRYSVVKIADNAFKGNTKLKRISIGANINTIGKNAFSGCKNLKTITIYSKKIKKIGKNAIKGIKKNAVIKVPKTQYKLYKKLFTSATGFQKSMKIKI